MRLRFWFASITFVAALLLVACGGGGDDSDEASTAMSRGDDAVGVAQSNGAAAAEADAEAPADDGAAAQPGLSIPGVRPAPGNTGGDNAEPISLQVIVDSRDIIYSSNMVVTVEDVALATRQAQTEIAALGGLVFGQDTTTSPRPRTVITFKVRPEDFQEALTRLAALGELESQQVSADDVTDRVVDLESRIITSEASVERLRNFLENATDLETVASLERELLQRETDLELLRGQLRTINDLISLATIFLTLVEPEPPLPEARVELIQTGYLGTDEGARCPDDDELTIDEGEPFTVCISVENTGTLALTEIEIRDDGLDLDDDEFVVLEGALDRLEPGDRLVGYFDVANAAFPSFPSPNFSAVAVDEDGEPVRIPVQVEREVLELDVIEDTSIPGFADGLSESWETLVDLGRVALLALGVLIPFIWVPALAIAAVAYGRSRMPRRQRRAAIAVTPPSEDGETPED